MLRQGEYLQNFAISNQPFTDLVLQREAGVVHHTMIAAPFDLGGKRGKEVVFNLQVSSSVTVRNAALFRAELIDAIDAHDEIQLDLAPVSEVDLGFVQLICAARIDAGNRGKTLRLQHPAPAPIAALLERAGFLAAPAPDDLDFWFHGERPQ